MKVLIVRFSSIGDIVLTSPIVRAVKEQVPDCELHFLTKKKFVECVESNSNIDRIHTIEKSIDEIIPHLKELHFDHVIDLHHNIRTKSLKSKLGVPMTSFKKLNIKKWLLVKLKWDKMPSVHVVDRYFDAVASIGVKNKGEQIEFGINSANEVDISQYGIEKGNYICAAIGAQFATKRLPSDKLVEILKKVDERVVLIGGETDQQVAQSVLNLLPEKNIIDLTGRLSIQQSASVVRQSKIILTHDTGMMHIASAFEIPIVSVWGNTVPRFGMYPYRPSNKRSYSIHQVSDLSCRPCSKIGFTSCPKKHFNCMNHQNIDEIVKDLIR